MNTGEQRRLIANALIQLKARNAEYTIFGDHDLTGNHVQFADDICEVTLRDWALC